MYQSEDINFKSIVIIYHQEFLYHMQFLYFAVFFICVYYFLFNAQGNRVYNKKLNIPDKPIFSHPAILNC